MKRLVGIVVMLASSAWADIPPSDSLGCRDKIAGVACQRDDGSEGTCGNATCSRRDYSNGPPGTSVKYDCLKCLAAVQMVAPPPPTPMPMPAPAPAAPEKKSSCAAVPVETALGLLALVFFRRRAR